MPQTRPWRAMPPRCISLASSSLLVSGSPDSLPVCRSAVISIMPTSSPWGVPWPDVRNSDSWGHEVIQLHVVWDWNGTLLDDLEVVIEAANVGLSEFDIEPLDEDRYRDHFTRPVRAFYDSLFGRPVTDGEWHRLNDVFHAEYMARADRARLTPEALDALDAVGSDPRGQSLLSMSPQQWLEGIVERRGVIERFSLVSGLNGETGGLKAAHMEEHIGALGLDPHATVVIGDTPDDATAARHVGAHVVLYDGGSHHLPVLHQTDAPVAHSLLDAVEIAKRL